jgi:hypothetical protein
MKRNRHMRNSYIYFGRPQRNNIIGKPRDPYGDVNGIELE